MPFKKYLPVQTRPHQSDSQYFTGGIQHCEFIYYWILTFLDQYQPPHSLQYQQMAVVDATLLLLKLPINCRSRHTLTASDNIMQAEVCVGVCGGKARKPQFSKANLHFSAKIILFPFNWQVTRNESKKQDVEVVSWRTFIVSFEENELGRYLIKYGGSEITAIIIVAKL